MEVEEGEGKEHEMLMMVTAISCVCENRPRSAFLCVPGAYRQIFAEPQERRIVVEQA